MNSDLAAQPEVLSVADVSFEFAKRPVLSDLGFRLTEGSILGLLGPNGSGKSTVVNLVAGLLRPHRGSILFFGSNRDARDSFVRSQFGVVFQSPSLDPKLTCEQNLKLAAKLHGLSGRTASTAVDQQLDFAGLVGRNDDRVAELSGGLRRRLDIARALLPRPRLLLLDEPTAGLDELSFRHLWSRLKRLREEQRLTILLSTHRPDEAEQCDLLGILVDGKLTRMEAPDRLQREVAKDVIVLRADDLGTLKQDIESHFQLRCLVDRQQLLVECVDGHLLIPRLVERYAHGRLSSVSLRRPTLGDVFLKLTGQTLDESPGEIQ